MAASAGSPPASWRAWRRVDIPAYGYGIRYDNGLFRQEINDGWQVELPENWLAHGNPWEFERREAAYEIGFGGTVDAGDDRRRQRRASVWQPAEKVLAVAFDTPIVGWRGKRVNTLRLWTAQRDRPDPRSTPSTRRPYRRARRAHPGRDASPACSIPPTSTPAGQELRLRQEYLLLLRLAAGHRPPPRPAVRRHPATSPTRSRSSSTTPIRPIAVAELMRLLIDVHGLDLGRGLGRSPTRTISYTNHTLLPEALESWPVPLFERLLPRHMQIIYAINAELLHEARSEQVRRRPRSAVGLADRRARRAARAHGPIWPSSARTRSTASRRCTPS